MRSREEQTAERTYTEEEFTALLKRAAELQSGAEAGSALTLRDVEQIAEAAGIGAQYIRQAAGTIDRAPANEFALLGPPSRVQITGSETALLDQRQLSDLLEEVRRITGRQGVVHGVLDALEWKARGPLGATYVTVRQRDDEVRVTVLSNRSDAKTAVYFLAGAAGFVVILGATAALHSGAAGSLSVIGAGALSAYAAARSVWGIAARRFRTQVDQIYEAVMQKIGKAEETTPP